MLGGQSRNVYSYSSCERLQDAGEPALGPLGVAEREVHVAVGEVGRQQVQALGVGALEQPVDVALAAHELAPRRP